VKVVLVTGTSAGIAKATAGSIRCRSLRLADARSPAGWRDRGRLWTLRKSGMQPESHPQSWHRVAAAIGNATIASAVDPIAFAPRTAAVAHVGSDPLVAAAPAPAVAAARVAAAAAVPHIAAASSPSAAATVAPRAAAAFALESPRASCVVLSPGRYKLELTVAPSAGPLRLATGARSHLAETEAFQPRR
jgi:hypothetical protein